MKDSSIAWIGAIPNEWSIQRVKHAFTRKNEKAMQEDPVILSLARSGVKIRDISTNEGQVAESYFNYNPVDVDDLLLNPMDLYSGANCSISKVTGVISPAYINLKSKEGINPAFYDYYFKVQYWMMAFFAHGKGVSFENRWTLNAETIMNYPIVSLPYNEQCRIADFLDAKCAKIDSIVEKQQQVIEKLIAYKQSVITETVTKGLNPDVPMKDSGVEWIGLMPASWKVAKLGSLFSFIGGYAYNSDVYVSESNNQVLRIGNVKNGQLLLDANPVYINDETAKQTEKFKMSPGCILFTMTGTKGKRDYFFTHLLDEKDCAELNLYLNQRVGCLLPTDGICTGYYNYLLKDNHILDSIFLYETGTANQGNLGIESIRRTKLQLPPYKEQCAIYEYLNKKCRTIESAVAKKQNILDKLTEYKKALIYEAVTGKLEV